MKFKNLTPGKIVLKIIVILLLIIEIYPILWMLTASVKTPSEFASQPSYSLPHSFYFLNYVKAWTTGKMYIFFKNSVIDTMVSLLFISLFSVTAAFAIAKMKWKFKGVFYNTMIAGITVPGTPF